PLGLLFLTTIRPRADAPWAIESRPLGAERQLRCRQTPGTKPDSVAIVGFKLNSHLVEHVRLRLPAKHSYSLLKLTKRRLHQLPIVEHPMTSPICFPGEDQSNAARRTIA